MVPKAPKEPSNGAHKGTEGSMGKGGRGIYGCIVPGSTVGNKGIPPIDILNTEVPKGSIYELSNCVRGSEGEEKKKISKLCATRVSPS